LGQRRTAVTSHHQFDNTTGVGAGAGVGVVVLLCCHVVVLHFSLPFVVCRSSFYIRQSSSNRENNSTDQNWTWIGELEGKKYTNGSSLERFIVFFCTLGKIWALFCLQGGVTAIGGKFRYREGLTPPVMGAKNSRFYES
jgi:hypothetical protein